MSVHAVKIFRSKELKLSLIAQSIAGMMLTLLVDMIIDIRREENMSISEIIRLRPVFVGSFFQKQIPMLRGNKIG